MRAFVINSYGDGNVFSEADLPRPKIKEDEVLIKVHATSVNPLDYKLRRGDFADFTPNFPAILNLDVAGIVEEVGANVSNLKIGDEVFGIGGGLKQYQGCLAQYVASPSGLITKKPTKLSMIESASIPLASLTAWKAIIDSVNIKRNETILIFGATGGVGNIAIQLAKWRGAKVITTASDSNKANIAQNLAADLVVNYKTEDLDKVIHQYTNGIGVDYVFDTIGGDNFERCLNLAKLRGHVISINARQTYDLTLAAGKGITIHLVNVTHPLVTGLWQSEQRSSLSQLAQLLDDGIIKPLIDPHIFKIHEIGKAQKLVEDGLSIGKVCLSW